MKSKKTLFIMILIFVLLIGGASVLYTVLKQQITPDRLVLQGSEGSNNRSETTNAGSPADDETPDDKDPADSDDTDDNRKPADSGETADNRKPADSDETADTDDQRIPAPDFTVYDAEGNEVKLSDYIGKPIVLNFWASWCGPCQMEMPDFHEKYLELGEDIQFLMINMTDGSRETIESASAFLEENEYTFPVFFDTDANAAVAYSAYSLPTTYFIDAEGYAIAQARGAIDAETLQQGIEMIQIEMIQ